MAKGRSIESRVQQRKSANVYLKRSRETVSQEASANPQRKRIKNAVKLSEAAVERAASAQRSVQAVMTEARNRANQVQPVQPRIGPDDETKFFADIDSPLSKVCASCGERVLPKTTKTVLYNGDDRRFKLLEVRNGRGLIDAGIHLSNGEELVTFCARCDRSLSQRQVPRYSAASGFELGPIPACLARLNAMEARMIGIGVCFTTCFTLGPLGQSASRGNSINFWNEVYDVVISLPRPAEQCGVIRMKRAGSPSQESYYRVRPWYLREALMWLKAHNPIYQHIIIDDDLLDNMPEDPTLPEVEMEEGDCQDVADASETTDHHQSFTESFVLGHEVSSEREEDKIRSVLDGSNGDQAYILSRHDKPMNEYETRLLMQSCFPTLFPDGHGGFHPIRECEERKHTYKLAEYCSHLMAFHDRRFIVHPTFKFFCLNLVQRRQIDGLLTQVKLKPGSRTNDDTPSEIPVGEDDVTNSKDVTRQYLKDLKPFFRSVRGTSLYWSNVRDDVMAMIGNPAMDEKWPTFFVTLSAADTVWPDFFRVCDPSLTFDEAANLSPSMKRTYLNDNPDLAAHHFHRRFQSFFQHILCGESRPLGEIVDFFWRIEFQHRGSPHVHALFWVANAPDILELSKTPVGLERLRCFADDFVSCFQRHGGTAHASEDTGDPLCKRPPPKTDTQSRACDLERLVDRVQQHVCTARSSCQRNGKCRFDFPKQVQEATVITRDESQGSVQISFHHRRDNDATNNYNADMLSAWRANMDVKIIGNAYGAAEYVAAYVSKAEPDSVRFYRTIEQALRKIPTGVPREILLKRTANTLLAIREVSAQEAVYILSNTLCLYGKSRTVLKVKVSRHDRRYYRLPHDQVSKERLSVLRSDGVRLEDVETAYMQRPSVPHFETLTFREFCESYELSKAEPAKGQHLERWKRLDNQGYIKSRRQKQLVRPSPRYRIDEASADYCYAQLFLHQPWRQLDEIPMDDDAVIEAYRQWKDRGASRWVTHIGEQVQRSEAIANAEQARDTNLALPAPNWSFELHADPQPDAFDPPPTAVPFQSRFHYSDEDVARAKTFAKDVLRPYSKSFKDGADKALFQHLHRPYTYPTSEQHPAMTSDQWTPFAAAMSQSRRRALAKCNGVDCSPMQMIICGEGGTGKSWLIQHIIQDMGVVFGAKEAKKRILVMAHQGSAAYLVGGRTISSALGFSQSCNFRDPYEPLVASNGGQTTLQRLQREYEDVHLLIVDEFGTVSSGMMYWIDQRLREIFPAHRGLPFGGRDVIFTGDPGQLPPVKPSALSTPKEQLKTDSEREGRKLWTAITQFYMLQQQNRGQGDPEWFSMLARVRRGLPQPGDLELINTRAIRHPTSRKTVTYLAYRNVDVAEANMAALNAQKNPVYCIQAHHQLQSTNQGDLAISDEGVKMILKEAKEMAPLSAKHLPATLHLAVGAPITLTFNMEQSLGLCNGSRGTVYDIINDRSSTQPIVLVRMDDYTGPSFLENVSGVIPITCRSASLISGKKSTYRLTRTALPLRLAYATTIHKSQGQTCECVVLNPSSMENCALAYVALSRVRNRQDFFLTASMSESQLRKLPSAQEVDDAEAARVLLLQDRTVQNMAVVVSEMMMIAQEHNHQVSVL